MGERSRKVLKDPPGTHLPEAIDKSKKVVAIAHEKLRKGTDLPYGEAALKNNRQTVADVSAKVLEARRRDDAMRAKPTKVSELLVPADIRMLGQLRVFPDNSKHRQRLRRVDIEHVNDEVLRLLRDLTSGRKASMG